MAIVDAAEPLVPVAARDPLTLIHEQARSRPSAVAIASGEGSLSYGELVASAGGVASALREAGVVEGDLVGLAMPRGSAAIVAMLGILEAGAGYVPFDPSYPASRLADMVDDVEPRLILVSESYPVPALPNGTATMLLAGLPAAGSELSGTAAMRLPELAVTAPAFSGETEPPSQTAIAPTLSGKYADSAELSDEAPDMATLSGDSSVVSLAELLGGDDSAELPPDTTAPADAFFTPDTTAAADAFFAPDTIAPAYAIFTSGSTGRPKAVLVPRRALASFCAAAAERYAVTARDRWLHFAPISFDASVEEIFVPLTAGATVVIRDDEMISRAELFLRRCADLGVTVLDLPTSYWLEVLGALDRGEAVLPESVRTVIIGGEAVSVSAVRDWQRVVGSRVTLLNTYGPTETTVVVSVADLTVWEGDGPVPIGYPLADVECRVIDGEGAPVPAGQAGELVIGGPFVASGYVRRPELTAERFGSGDEYRTGDRVRWRPDGQLEYLGRFDRQLKIRGFRVEPGEVEAALRRLPGVTDAVVLGDEDRLVAHLLTTSDIADVRRLLAADLPAYLVPAAFVRHASFPRTSQGKNDRAALAAANPNKEQTHGGGVADLWRSLLPGDDDDFFAAGGDSLVAVRLLSALRREFGVAMTLSELYSVATLPALTAAVESRVEGTAADHGWANHDESVPLPLTALQREFWIAEQISADRPVHTLGIRYRLGGSPRLDILRRALDEMVRRHPMLRARVTVVGDDPCFVVEPDVTVPLIEGDANVGEPFDLATAPLARVHVTGDELLLVVHHLVFDGWSAGVFGGELGDLYRTIAGGGTPAPHRAPLLDLRARQAADTSADYWRDRLDGVDLDVALPTDRPRPATPVYTAARLTRPIDVADLDRHARENRSSLFVLLLAGLQTLLHRYTGKRDVTVLATVAGRTDPALEGHLGMAINVLPVRGVVDGGFEDLLSRTGKAVTADLEHQDLALPGILAASGRRNLQGSTGLGPVVLIVHNTPHDEAGELRYIGDTGPSTTMDHLTIGLDLTADGAVLNVDYATELYDRDRIEALTHHLLALVTAGVSEPRTPVAELPMLAPDEQDLITRQWNDTAFELTGELAVQQFLEHIAVTTPDAPALTHRGSTIDYRTLNARANRLAWALRDRGVVPGDRVAICLDRGIELFVVMWGVLKAGAAYVPLDPAYPVDRLHYMLTDSRSRVLVTRLPDAGDITRPPVSEAAASPGVTSSPGSRGATGAASPDVLSPDDADAFPDTDPPLVNGPDDPAYVMYTSGSTGRAKGVVVSHGNLVHAVRMWQRAYDLRPEWTYQQQASFSFDMFVCETFRALCTGGRLVVVPRETLLDPSEFYALMRTEQVRCTELVPAVLRMLLEHVEDTGADLSFVRLLICGGEKWHVGEFRRARALVGPGNRVINAYGVTEGTADSTYFDGSVDHLPDEAPLPIGRPFPNCRVYVLDEHRRPVPPGVIGELYLGGLAVATGYFDRPELTAERFVADPFAGGDARMYKSGDAARYHRDGLIDFLGRLDDQVKINGYRVELGEVEAALGALPGVASCAATVRPGPSGLTQLLGYVVTRAGAAAGAGARAAAGAAAAAGAGAGAAAGAVRAEQGVRDALAAVLPTHMVPARVVFLDALPLSPNGKIDRNRLPAPPDDGGLVRTAPRTPTEKRLAEAWCAELALEELGIDDNFFAVGGDSFAAVKLVRRIDPAPSLVDLYQNPTVRGLAALLDERHPAVEGGTAGGVAATGERPLLYRLTRRESDVAAGGRTVVAVPYSGGSAIAYQPLADALPSSWALHAVELPGHDRNRPFEPLESASRVAERVVAEMRTLSGPIVLYGHCLSVAITVEIARRAEAAGIDLAGVGLGAGLPTARLSGPILDWFTRLQRMGSKREYIEYLRGRGGFTDVDDPAEQAFVVRNVKHDEQDAEEYFSAAYREKAPTLLKAPVVSVIGQRDRVTDHYQERYLEWEHFAGDVSLAVLPNAGHFFIKSHADELSAVLVDLGAPRDETPPLSPLPQDSPVRPSVRRFGVVALGQFVSMIGSGLSSLVLSIWVYQRTGSLTQFAVLSAIGLLPGILAGPLAGAVADRWDRRRVMLVSDLSAALAMGAVIAVMLAGTVQEWHLYLAVSVTSIAGAFQRPAYLAAVSQLVPKRYLGHAVGITQLGVAAGVTFAPMLGAALFGVVGLTGVLVIDVASFLTGVLTLLWVRFPNSQWRRRDEPFREEIAAGWRYLSHRPSLRAVLRYFVVDHVLYTLGFAVITPLLLIEHSPLALGAVLSAGGIGGLAGAVLMTLWGGTARRASGMIIFMGVSSLGMTVIGAGGSVTTAVIGMFLLTFGEVLAESHWIAVVQNKVGFDLQGRVLAVFITLMMLTMPIGYLIVGPLAERFVEPLLAPGGALAGSFLGTGEGRSLALLVLLSGLLQIAWCVRGWFNRSVHHVEDTLPDALPPAEVGDRDALQRQADELLAAHAR
ncbi:non-ribosomal peptide synthetase/MFS transporter [Actinoplanes solisilvae]|uniref:non-ribosomal peptide synthetase/MFS transporter n=1 Tax=Actinoplanes solisilvae TaxID=2486853 RepID=UPI000FDCC884|nr:non-ribosomal peptide synthetase/MFS transporter [Actinoplanes solisilvae]